ncbi:Dimethylaniline monooxygenase [N-oxide-forming] 5-like protein, partial [Leptotrombidium deliense]
SKNRVQLYKNVFQPKLKHPQTLAVIGLVQPLGAIFPIAELHSRWFCLLMKGQRKLPSEEQMLRIVKEDNERNAKRYYESTRHTIQVDWVACMDEIATLVGVKPNLYTIALTDPLLWYKMYFGPCLPYQYRLTGPHPWKGA